MSDNQISRIVNKLDKIEDSIVKIEVTMAKNTESLVHHIKRTDLLEQKLEPIEAHVHMVNGVFKFIGALSLLVGIAVGLVKLLA